MSPEYINDLVEIKTSTYNFRAENHAEVPGVNATRYGLRSIRSERYVLIQICSFSAGRKPSCGGFFVLMCALKSLLLWIICVQLKNPLST